jgi:hypothetical protein
MSEHVIDQVMHFKSPGPKNTQTLMQFAADRCKALGLTKVVIATTSGRTIDEALSYFQPLGITIIAVTHVVGYAGPNAKDLSDEKQAELEAKGVKIVTAAHAFGGVGRGIRSKLDTFQIDEIMAYTLRMLGQGAKVGVEVTLMAADRGFVRTDEDVMAIGGTGKGADTAMVVRPANSHACLDFKIREITAKPNSI